MQSNAAPARWGPDDLLAPIALVSGPEGLLAERAVEAVCRAARRADPACEVTGLAAAEVSAGGLAELTGPSLFASRRVLVLRDVQDGSDELIAALREYAAAPAEETHIVVVHPGGTKGKAVLDALRAAGVRQVAADKLTRPDDQVLFVRSEVTAAGTRIRPQAAQRLVDAVGGDLRSLAAAAAQLAADAEGEIDDAMVATYYEGRAEVRGWTIADHAVEGRTAEAVRELRWALDAGTAPVLVVGALAGALRTLGRLGSLPRGLREADVARELGVPAWKVRRLREQLRGWTPTGLEAAVHAVAAVDVAVKGGSNDAGLALTQAVLAVTGNRSAA